MQSKTFRLLANLLSNQLQTSFANTSCGKIVPDSTLIVFKESLPRRIQPMTPTKLSASFTFSVALLANRFVFSFSRLRFGNCEYSFVDQLFSVSVEYCWMFRDFLVHQWLGEHGVVDFVVTVSSVADDV